MTNSDLPTTDQPVSRSTSLINGTVLAIVLGLGVAVYFTPLKTWLAEGQLIRQELELFGVAAPLVFVVAAALLTAVGVPRLLLCSLGGMSFGFAGGLLWTQIGTVAGSYLTFLFIRWRGRDYALSHFPRLRRLSQTLEGRGLMSVLLIRQLPMNGFYNNVLLGLTPVGHRDFLLGSLLGFLPLGVTACLLGAGLIQGEASRGVQYVALAVVCSIGLGWALKHFLAGRAAPEA